MLHPSPKRSLREWFMSERNPLRRLHPIVVGLLLLLLGLLSGAWLATWAGTRAGAEMDSTWATLAAIGTWILAAVPALQLAYLLEREGFQRRQEQARFGYQLLDALFDDELASSILKSLDYSRPPSGAHAHFAKAFHFVFIGDHNIQDEFQARVYERTDALLYHFDRFEHAIRADVTLFEDLETPSCYYVKLLSKYKRNLERYANDVGYHRAVAFMDRFPAWRNSNA